MDSLESTISPNKPFTCETTNTYVQNWNDKSFAGEVFQPHPLENNQKRGRNKAVKPINFSI